MRWWVCWLRTGLRVIRLEGIPIKSFQWFAIFQAVGIAAKLEELHLATPDAQKYPLSSSERRQLKDGAHMYCLPSIRSGRSHCVVSQRRCLVRSLRADCTQAARSSQSTSRTTESDALARKVLYVGRQGQNCVRLCSTMLYLRLMLQVPKRIRQRTRTS